MRRTETPEFSRRGVDVSKRLKGSKDVTPRCTPTRRPHKARIRSAASYAVTQLLHCVIACIAYRRTDRASKVRTYMVVGSWYGNSTPRPDTNLLDVLVRCGPGRRNILILIWRRTPRRDAPRRTARDARCSAGQPRVTLHSGTSAPPRPRSSYRRTATGYSAPPRPRSYYLKYYRYRIRNG